MLGKKQNKNNVCVSVHANPQQISSASETYFELKKKKKKKKKKKAKKTPNSVSFGITYCAKCLSFQRQLYL